MAYADYRHCDICDCKVFYDAHLNYEQGKDVPAAEMARHNGDVDKYGYRLDRLGDWSVICRECAKSFKTTVIALTQAEVEGEKQP